MDPAPVLLRRRSGTVVAGVAGGIADHLGTQVIWVRTAFVALTVLAGGAGLLAYALLWIFVRQESVDVRRSAVAGERLQTTALVLIAVGAGLALTAGGDSLLSWVVGPLGAVAVGVGIVWRAADGDQRARWMMSATWAGGRAAALRVVTGLALIAAGLAVFLLGNVRFDQIPLALVAVVATVVGVFVVTLPWWLRLVRERNRERQERLIEAERAEVAAHLHDSVLQTLALIQRADNPAEMLRHARRQERELRQWLYGPAGYRGVRPGAAEGGAVTLCTEAVTSAAAEVEDAYGVTIRPVTVGGDRELTPALGALVLAAREAMVNAAKHAQVSDFTVFVEVSADDVQVFVRDRGIGFNPGEVSSDRRGLTESIHHRVTRHGGFTALKSSPGTGTEVELRMPLQQAHADAHTPHARGGSPS